jgi:hypothetical protein
MPKPITITWLSQPEKHDYSAAKSFLSLLYRKPQTRTSVRKLRQAPVSEYKAKDIFRASGLSQLGLGNSHVERDRQTITSGQALSPLLLVRDPDNGKVLIADGYHRLCAVYSYDEEAIIPCKIV